MGIDLSDGRKESFLAHSIVFLLIPGLVLEEHMALWKLYASSVDPTFIGVCINNFPSILS